LATPSQSFRHTPLMAAPGRLAPIRCHAHPKGVPCKGRILLVDDDAGIREALRASFEAHGCTVVEAADGVEAMQCLNGPSHVCLVLSDLNMPRLDGESLLRRIRRDRRRCDLPVVSMSADLDRRAPPAVQRHLEKPFHFPALLPSIERYCQDPHWLHSRR
jgi:CheY-like chemotaxis protein